MQIELPDPQTTLAVLLGASEWPRWPEFYASEAFSNSARAFKDYLLDLHGLHLPSENLLDCFDSNQSSDKIDETIGQFLKERLAEMEKRGSAAKDFLLYFVGHGGFVGGSSDFFLAIRRTRQDNPEASGLRLRPLATTIKEHTRDLRRILILDCCYAGAAFHAFQGAGLEEAVRIETDEAFKGPYKLTGSQYARWPRKGTALLCSSSRNKPSIVGEEYTAFSEALLHVLYSGDLRRREALSLETLVQLIRDCLREIQREAPRPEVHAPDQSEGDVALVPFFPNLALDLTKADRRVVTPPEILRSGVLWTITEDALALDSRYMHDQEAVYTVGNGYFGTRGTFEEDYPNAMPGTLLSGVFDSITIPFGTEELACVPDWLPVKLFLNGKRFSLETGKVLGYERTLDMQCGILNRIVRWESPAGIRLRIQCERFASLADEHFGAIRYSVTIEELPYAAGDLYLVLLATFNIVVGNNDLMHWKTIDLGHDNDLVWLQSETRQAATAGSWESSSPVQLIQTMSFTTNAIQFDKEIVESEAAPNIQLKGFLATGETVIAEKIVGMFTSRDTTNPYQEAIENHRGILERRNKRQAQHEQDEQISLYEALRSRHIEAWRDYWDVSDLIIEGDEKAQLGMRYHIYQMRINASLHDSRYSIPMRGLTGFGQKGHISYETEIFMLPFYYYVMPETARNLLLYRYRTLPAAHQKAASNGCTGAQYPCESTLSGEERTPTSIIHPETGEVIPVLNGEIELHITASIAFAVWQYWRVTGDDEFMRHYGAEIELDTAMFWASRAEYSMERNEYAINDVIGPDEWHVRVNNNAYTNYMARWNIETALDVLDWLHTHAPKEAKALTKHLQVTDSLLEHWRDVIAHMRIPQDKHTGLFEQFDGFFQLESFDQDLYKGRKDSYQAILGFNFVERYQIIKQDDVLMLLTMLDDQFDLKTKRMNWDYYYPITDRDYGSPAALGLSTILACRLGLIENAYRYFQKELLVDLEHLRKDISEGIHLDCCGAAWQAVIFGFAGLKVSDGGCTTNPKWPDGWTRLAFTIKYNGKSMRIDLQR